MADGQGTVEHDQVSRGSIDGISTVVLVVSAETSPRRSSEIMRWVRALLPAALILVSSAPMTAIAAEDVITVRVDDVDEGPLAVAAELARQRADADERERGGTTSRARTPA